MKKFFVWFLVIIVFLGSATVTFLHFAEYSEGIRAGMVLKVSKRGTIFKTYEGQLDLQSFGAVRSSNKLSQTFEFSVPKDQPQLINKLEEAALEGTRVRLRYKEKFVALPWIGDSKYLVTKVESSGKKSPNDSDYPE